MGLIVAQQDGRDNAAVPPGRDDPVYPVARSVEIYQNRAEISQVSIL